MKFLPDDPFAEAGNFLISINIFLLKMNFWRCVYCLIHKLGNIIKILKLFHYKSKKDVCIAKLLTLNVILNEYTEI